MAIAYETQTLFQSTAANSLAVSKPSGTVEGDLLVCVVGYGNDAGARALPSGWQLVDNYTIHAGFSDYFHVGYKFAGPSEPATYTFLQTYINTIQGVIQRFSGVDTYGGAATPTANTNVTSCTFNSVTPDEDGCLLILIGGGYHNNGCATPSGYSNTAIRGGVTGPDTFMSSRVQATAAATGTITSTGWLSFSNYPQRGHQLWFRPASSGQTATPSPVSVSLSGVTPVALKSVQMQAAAAAFFAPAISPGKSIATGPVAAAFSAPAISPGKSIATGPVAAAFSAPAPSTTLGGGGGQVANPLPVAAAFPTPTVTTRKTSSPAAVAATFSVPAPSLAKAAQPAPVSAAFSAPAIGPGKSIAAGPVAATLSVPTFNYKKTATPAAVAATFSVPAPSLAKAAQPDPVAAAFSILAFTTAGGVAGRDSVQVMTAAHITTDLNAAGLGVTAVRSWADWDDKLEDLDTLHVDVVPAGFESIELENRGRDVTYRTLTDIGVRQRFGQAASQAANGRLDLGTVDALALLTQQIHEHFSTLRDNDADNNEDLVHVDTDLRVPFVRDHLRSLGQWTSVIRLTHETTRPAIGVERYGLASEGSAVEVNTAAAIAGAINAAGGGTFAVAATAVRSWADWDDKLEDLDTLHVDVVPAGFESIELEGRRNISYRNYTDVGVRQRLDQADAATGRLDRDTLDTLSLLTEQLFEYLTAARPHTDSTIHVDTDLRVPFVRDHLRSLGQWTSVIRLTHETTRTAGGAP